jgi:hypothetical protein
MTFIWNRFYSTFLYILSIEKCDVRILVRILNLPPAKLFLVALLIFSTTVTAQYFPELKTASAGF